jgi:hypothetical protein
MDASFTYQGTKDHWGSDSGNLNPQNQWCSDGYPYVAAWGFDISGTFNARQGWKIRRYFYIWDDTGFRPGGDWTSAVYTQPVVNSGLPSFWNVTLRLEKKINIGAGRMYVMADVFNLFNKAIINREYDYYLGDVYTDQGVAYGSWVNPTNGTIYEILNPRIFRFGVRFEF